MSAKNNEIEALVENLMDELVDSLMCEIDCSDEDSVKHAILYLEKLVQDLDYTDYIE